MESEQPINTVPVQPSMPVHHLDLSNEKEIMPAKGNLSMSPSSARKLFIPLCAIAIVGGSLTGVGLSKLKNKPSGDTGVYQGQVIQKVAGDSISNGQVFGSADEKIFADSAEGYLEVGGVDGEGTHHLLREGGPSQTVYMTSSVTDLSKFEGMKVKVWGESQKPQKVGWLMDVGRVQVQDIKGTPPSEK